MFQPKVYEDASDVVREVTVSTLNKYFHLLKIHPNGEERILDIGCGDGKTTVKTILSKFPKKSTTIVGCDQSREMLDYASKMYGNGDTITFRHLDIGTKYLPEDMKGCYDHAFSIYVLHWVVNQKQALRNIYDSLKPGGETFIFLVARHGVFTVYKTMATTENKWSKYLSDLKTTIYPFNEMQHPEKHMEELLKEIGFVDIVSNLQFHSLRWDNIDTFRSFLLAISPFIRKITESEWSNHINDQLSYFKNMNLIEEDPINGVVNDSLRTVVIVARKPTL